MGYDRDPFALIFLRGGICQAQRTFSWFARGCTRIATNRRRHALLPRGSTAYAISDHRPEIRNLSLLRNIVIAPQRFPKGIFFYLPTHHQGY